jgi:threonine synthase
LRYYSTNRNSESVSFKEATIKGQAPDKGLYFPEELPALDPAFIQSMESVSNEELAFRVMQPFIGDEIPEEDLYRIVGESIHFPMPLVQLNESVFSLELFHGPTLAFKDVGARFMSRCLGYFLQNENRNITVLVATSGDTGGAVAHGFYDVPGVDVVILYPSGKVSPVQEKQLTTLGKNIHALEIEGTFDDCQKLVKTAFADAEINKKIFLTSANSINVARWLPQQIYYFLAYKQWPEKHRPPVISVPSGNFGNICAGMLARQCGLPVQHFIAACNVNDTVTKYLQTEIFQSQEAIPTLSNAMDVGNPSNFIRILEIFYKQFPQVQNRFSELKKNLSSFSFTDEETLAAIKDTYAMHHYLLDPHGAVGLLALQKFLGFHKEKKGIFLETAHPVKFPEAVENATGTRVEVPSSLHNLMLLDKKSKKMKPSFSLLREYLLR